jgi:hypothetical protein
MISTKTRDVEHRHEYYQKDHGALVTGIAVIVGLVFLAP